MHSLPFALCCRALVALVSAPTLGYPVDVLDDFTWLRRTVLFRLDEEQLARLLQLCASRPFLLWIRDFHLVEPTPSRPPRPAVMPPPLAPPASPPPPSPTAHHLPLLPLPAEAVVSQEDPAAVVVKPCAGTGGRRKVRLAPDSPSRYQDVDLEDPFSKSAFEKGDKAQQLLEEGNNRAGAAARGDSHSEQQQMFSLIAAESVFRPIQQQETAAEPAVVAPRAAGRRKFRLSPTSCETAAGCGGLWSAEAEYDC